MKKNILIVDDSILMRKILSDAVNSDTRFQVKDTAENGEEAYKLLFNPLNHYDVVLLDLYMPKKTGLELLSDLSKRTDQSPRVVICSTKADESSYEVMTALDLGAFDFIKKPENLIHAQGSIFTKKLLAILAAAVEVKPQYSTNIPRLPTVSPLFAANQANKISTIPLVSGTGTKLIALACSTGGPKTLQSVIPYLPANMNAPMVLVQHMPKGFTNSLAERLNDMSKVKVKEAVDREVMKKGHVYIAPGGKHLKVGKSAAGYQTLITDDPQRDALKPCANIMYESLMDSAYDEIICVVLTGMGSDGTVGIRELKKRNKVYVIAQDEATSVVYGMPKMVAQAGLADEIVPVSEVANSIIKKVGVQ